MNEWADDPDHDAHVRARERLHVAATIDVCQIYVDSAKSRCETALARLAVARKECDDSLAFLRRTVVTLEQACRLHTIYTESE